MMVEGLRRKRVSGMTELTVGIALASSLCVACQTMADVQPGTGTTTTITGHTYEEIWRAAMRVADEHFEIRESEERAGVIKAERTYSAWGCGAWVGIYITPPRPGASSYTIEVVRRIKLMTDAEQGWEHKVIRDLHDVLEGRPMR